MKLLLLPLAALLVAAAPADDAPYTARIDKVLKATPLIDGHNDWAESLRGREGDARWTTDFASGWPGISSSKAPRSTRCRLPKC